MIDVRILGPLQVEVDGTPVALRQGLSRTILLALVLRRGQPASADTLVDELYGDEPPANPPNALQVQVSNLRRVLAEAGARDVIVTEGSGYRLAIPPDAIDAVRFEHLVAGAAQRAAGGTAEGIGAAVSMLDEALGLWRGEPLADAAYRDFAAAEITRLTELRLAAMEQRLERRLDLGHHRDVVGDLQALVADHPLRERLHELLVIALYRAGRQADALRAYESARRTLADQLGLEPGAELQRLERAVLAHDPALDWAPPPSTDPAPPERATLAPLPAPVSALIGRTDELGRLTTLFERSRAVTITGPGGAGKTRLAIEHAATASQIWFVDLGPVEDDRTVAPTVAAAFGLPVKPDLEPLAGVAALDPAGLLVLDTCEHVVAAAADTVSHLLRACPRLRVLATSRRPLQIAGELTLPVPPLAVDTADSPGVRLFVDRAAAARPDFELTDANSEDVVAICDAVDGLPLAIELAAARLDVLSPAALRVRLRDRFELLDSGVRDAVERQRTLRAAIDWSYDLADTAERRLFQRLAVLPGPFPLELVTALGGHGSLETLRSLVRQSLVVVGGDERFLVLDTLRAYAAERADAADTAGALDDLAGWAESTVPALDDALRGAGQLDALARLRADLPNLRAVLEWTLIDGHRPAAGFVVAGRLAWFWNLVGMYGEAQRWLGTALRVQSLERVAPAARALVLLGAGLHATAIGHLADGARLLDASVAESDEAGDDYLGVLSRVHRGGAAWWAGLPDAADADLDAVIAATADPRDERWRWVHAYALLQKSRVALRREAYGESADLLARAGPELELLGDDHLRGLAVRFRARSASLQGDAGAAIPLAEEALRLSERLSHTEGVAISLIVLGEAQRGVGDLDGARTTLGRGIELAVAADHLSSACQALSLLVAIDLDRGDRDGATTLLRELLDAQLAAGLPVLTPGGVVQRLSDELLGGFPEAPPGGEPALARERLRRLALDCVR